MSVYKCTHKQHCFLCAKDQVGIHDLEILGSPRANGKSTVVFYKLSEEIEKLQDQLTQEREQLKIAEKYLQKIMRVGTTEDGNTFEAELAYEYFTKYEPKEPK